jgi:subtilisin-like proprotein convertase family protein
MEIHAQSTFNGGGTAATRRWHRPLNWIPNGEPIATTNAIIGAGICNVEENDDVCNNLTVDAGTTLNITNGAELIVNGNLIVGGTLNILTGGVLRVNGNITINVGGLIVDSRAGSGTFEIAGTSIVNNGGLEQPGSLYASLTNGTTVTISGTSTNYNNFAFNLLTAGQTVNFNASTSNVYGFSTSTGTTLNFGVGQSVNMSQLSIEGNANFNDATLTLRGGTTSNVSPDLYNPYFPTGQTGEGTVNAGTSTFIYSANATQFIRSGNYYNLIIQNYSTIIKDVGNASYTDALGQSMDVNVNNDLSLDVISSGGETWVVNNVNIGRHFNMAANNLAFSMDLITNRLMQRTGGTGSFTMGDNTNNRIFIDYTHTTNSFLQGYGHANTFYGTVIYQAASGMQKVVGANYNNLNLQNGATRELSSSVLINGNLNHLGGNFDATTSNFNIESKGNWTQSAGAFNARNNTVSFTGTINQTLSTIPSVNTSNFSNTPGTPVAIPDNTPAGGVATNNTIPTLASLTGRANIQVTVPVGTYTALNSFSFDITHTFNSDVDIYLVAPDNTVYLVSTDNGGFDANYTNTTIQDGATLISTGTAPFSGTFAWEDARTLASYAGPLNGTWTLYVIDDAGFDTGTINSFGVTLSTSTNPFTLNNVTFNKTGNLILAGTSTSININGLADFSNGYLVAGSQRVDFTATSNTSNASNTSHLIGTARKIGNTSFTFPLGNGTFYAGIGFNPSGTTTVTDHFTATYTRTSPNTLYPITSKEITIDHVSNCEYWMFDRTNGSQSATVSLHFDNVRSCGVTNTSELLVCRWDGAQWTNGGNGGVAGSFVTSATTFTSFSPFTLGSSTNNNPLPVGMVYFKVNKSDKDAVLEWKTEFELNSKIFGIERSFNAKDFEEISILEASGKGNTYNFTDKAIAEQTSIAYYRLKSVDKDGKYVYSKPQVVNFDIKEFDMITVYPNPIEKTFKIAFHLPNVGHVQTTITDALGQVVEKRIIEGGIGSNVYEFNNLNLSKGMYIVNLQYEGKSITKKIVR